MPKSVSFTVTRVAGLLVRSLVRGGRPWAATDAAAREDVLGLDVPVDDPVAVRVRERGEELEPERAATSAGIAPCSCRSLRSVVPRTSSTTRYCSASSGSLTS